MIRVRRLPPRIPVGKVYELEYQPENDPDAGWHGITRSPIKFVAPVLGLSGAHAFLEDADRTWDQGGGVQWAAQVQESPRPIGSWDAAPIPPQVGWGWLVAHVPLLALAVILLMVSLNGPELDGPVIDIGGGFAVINLFGLGLPWTLAAMPVAIGMGDAHGDVWFAVPAIAPAVLNLALHLGYRTWRARAIRNGNVPAVGARIRKSLDALRWMRE